MNKIVMVIIAIIILALAIFGVRMFSGEDNWICDNGLWIKHGNPSMGIPEDKCGEFWFDNAKLMAQNKAEEINASLTGNYEYNDYTYTVWFEINNADSIKEGCNPAVVFNMKTGETEINWRCTGLIKEE